MVGNFTHVILYVVFSVYVESFCVFLSVAGSGAKASESSTPTPLHGKYSK